MPWDFALILFVLTVVVPIRGRSKMRKLLAMPRVSPADRLALYAMTIASQWALVALVAWRCWVRGISSAELGLGVERRSFILLVSLLGSMVLAVVQWRGWKHRLAKLQPAYSLPRALAERILPRTNLEAPAFFALAVTAGLCEEFLYRGFLMTVLAQMGIPGWIVVLLSSVVFGLAHLYQGWRGALATVLLGALFGMARLLLRTLVPVVLWHTTIDVVAGIVGLRLVGKQGESPSQVSS